MTEYTDAELIHLGEIHDFTDPQSMLSRIEMIYAAVTSMPDCTHCTVTHRPLPMHGTAWGIDHIHEPGCPDDE